MKPFVAQHAAAVIEASQKGLFPSVFMAQMILESGWGQSKLATVYNNYFGVKADKAWKGKVVNLQTGEYFDGQYTTITDGFRVYDNPSDSIRDRADFLIQNPRYKPAFSAATPEEQAQALQDAGYATAPDYAAQLVRIINDNQLKTLDEKKKL